MESTIRNLREEIRLDAEIHRLSWDAYSAAMAELNRLAVAAGLSYMVW